MTRTRICSCSPQGRLTGCGWRSVPMCWRQRGGSVALRRQTPLGSEPSSSCFGFSGFDRLSLGLLELELILRRVFASALHEAQHGPLTAAPCRRKSNDTLKFKLKGTEKANWKRRACIGSRSCFSQGARVSVALASSNSIRALIMGVSVQLASLRWLWSWCLG